MPISNIPKNMVELAYDHEVRRTKLAILFDFGDKQAWIPESQIHELFDDSVIIPEWLAEDKGLI